VNVATQNLAPIFISYSTQDQEKASRVASSLEAAGLPIWIASREIQLADSFVMKINDALEKAGYVLLLLSRAALASRWVRLEWTSVLATFDEKATVLLPLKIEALAPLEIPALLRGIIYADLSASFESGMAKLNEYFAQECSRVQARRGSGLLKTATYRELRIVLTRCLDQSAFPSLLKALRIPEEQLGGKPPHGKIITLLQRVQATGTLALLIDLVERDHEAGARRELEKLRTNRLAPR